MADNKITIDIEVNGKMQKATVSTKKLRDALGEVDSAQEKVNKGNDQYQKGLKGVGQQSANASKNFSKFSSGMGGFVGVYASLAAQLFAVSAAFNFLKRSGDLEALKSGQLAYASATGIAMRSLAKDIQLASNAQITFQDASQAAAIGTAAGLSSDQLTRLGSAAADAAQILGRDVTDSFNRLVRGVTKAEPELLDELGIILRLNDATEEYARQLNKSANDLTQFEKSQAVVNDVLEQAEKKYSAILEITGRTPNEFAQLGIAFDNVTNKLKELTSFFAGPISTVLREFPLLAASAFSLLLAGPLKAMGFSLMDIANTAKASADIQVANIIRIKRERQALNNQILKEEGNLRMLASREFTAGSKSKILENLAKGGKLYGADKASLKRALRAAELQLIHHGEITKGIFKGRDAAIIASFSQTLDRMDVRVQQNATMWQKWSLSTQAAIARVSAAAQAGVAKAISGFTKLLSAAGWVAIGITIFKSLEEGFKRFTEKYSGKNPIQESFDLIGAEVEVAKEKIISLAEEYENFNVVQSVNMKYATTELEIFHNTAQNLGNMLATTFSGVGLEGIRTQFQGVKDELLLIAENTRYVDERMKEGFGETNAAALSSLLQFFGVGKESADSFGTSVLRFGAALERAVMTGDDSVMVTSLSKEAAAVESRINDSITSLQMFKEQVQKTTPGATTYKAFQEMSHALAAAQQVMSGGGLEGTGFASEDAIFAALEKGAQASGVLAGNLASLQQQTKATNDGFKSMENTLKNLSAGDNLRIAAEAELTTLNAVIKARIKDGKSVSEQVDRQNELNRIIRLGTDIAQMENDKKVYGLELQTEATRNYDKITNAQSKILKTSDKIAKSEMEASFIIRERNRLIEMYADENGNVTPEVQRQLDLLTARLDLENKVGDVLEEQLTTLQEQKPFLETIERQQGLLKILNLEKQIFDLNQKTAKAQLDTLKARFEMGMAGAQTGFNITTAQNPFIDQERAAAEFKLQQAIVRLAAESAFIDQETNAKKAQIEMEYELLAAKRIQTVAEAENTKILMRNKPELFSEDDIEKYSNAIQQLTDFDYDAQKAAMLANADALGERAKQKLVLGVIEAAAGLENEQPFDRLFEAAIDSFEKGLQDAFMLVFDSLTTEMDDFNDQLKDLGRGVIRTIQESLTQEFLVKPLMETLGDIFDFGEDDLASKIELALKYGGDDLAVKIQAALGGGVPPTTTTTNASYVPSMSGKVPPGGFTSYYQDPAGSTPMPSGMGVFQPPKLDIEAQKEAQEANTSALDNLTAETGVQIGALGTVLAGLTGNRDAAEKLALITAGFKAYQMAADLWKKLFGVKEQTTTMLLIAALDRNTASNLGSGLPGGKTGGVFSGGAKMAGYSSGGVARGSRAGYPVELHGTEAVVPLPNGRSIPVEMSGGAGQQNNVTVNVAVDNQGGATSSTGGISGDQAAKLGNAISEAVKKELLNQKRPGGMLSPYGVA